MTQWGMLQDANLQTELSYPKGVDGVAARITVRCRKSYVVIMEHDFTAEDLVDFMSRTLAGETKGASRVASEDQLKLVNKERRFVTVRLDSGSRWRLDREDSDHPEEWAAGAARAFAAQNHRVSYKKEGVDVSLMFYVADWGRAEQAFLDAIQERLNEQAQQRAERIERRFVQ